MTRVFVTGPTRFKPADLVAPRGIRPAVVLLIGTGIALRQVLDSVHLHLGWVDPIVPVIGTIGLILIVQALVGDAG